MPNTEIANIDDLQVSDKKVSFEKCGLVIQENLEYGEWQNIGTFLKTANQAVQWWIGDWLNYGEAKYGEKYTQALEQTDYQYHSLADFKWVSSVFEFSVRTENLSWTHHRVVSSLDKPLRDYWIRRAEREELSAHDLRRLVSSNKGKSIDEIENKVIAFSWFKQPEIEAMQEGIKAVQSGVKTLIDATQDRAVAHYILDTVLTQLVSITGEIEKTIGDTHADED